MTSIPDGKVSATRRANCTSDTRASGTGQAGISMSASSPA
jgi:hypothetical protein